MSEPYVFFVLMTQMTYNRSITSECFLEKKRNWVNNITRKSISLNGNNVFDSPRYLIHCMAFHI